MAYPHAPSDQPLDPASTEDVLFTLAHNLRFRGRRRNHDSEDAMARLTAEHLLKSLEASNFVIMHRRPPPATPAPDMTPITLPRND